ncbi:hypothetical protein BP6252_02199 [Coleophoma cylindrospora]|uniref:GEgh 16 protein n=1 Tax=Coleophoma cylindrospora TaxID=1849047 RepID=A0A3D8SE71_9HELO|nr:hypothetical protein BP6252_02199 [Coleophoma cylindrospora]
MPSLVQILLVAPAVFAVARGQGLIVQAQGTAGSPASLGLQVKLGQSDANIINTAEITSNVVNECGRTLLAGNIDVGENTETQLAAKTVTSVTKGGTVDVTIQQVSADGAGPYTCDMDLTSNADGATGQTNLTVTEKDTTGGNITLSVTMPTNMACVGASTGNVCTIRCFNSAAAGPFGGCFAVQQTDVTPNANSPNTITTAQTLAGVEAQVLQNQKDLPAEVKANSEASLTQQGLLAVNALLSSSAGVVAQATSTSSSKASKATKAAGAKAAGAKAAAAKAAAAKAKAGKGQKGARAFTA